MPTSTERDEGASNIERIRAEMESAALGVSERFPGYRSKLIDAAIECYKLTAEHSEKRIDINKKYGDVVNLLARAIEENRSGDDL
ncbi:hypothetical protein ACFV0L_07020 [Streptosporangium canum]|uniref:hypothetical protein n=1 Tax=Streptosporangium canum TaxID=324952 RepID=UPI003691AD57